MQSPIRRPALLALVVAGLVAAACGRDAQTQTEAPPPEVAVQTVKTERVELSVTLPGRVVAWRVAEVRPQVSGLIRERLFEEGETIKKGEPLYRIESAPYQAAYDSAVAALARAEALAVAAGNRAERFEDLVEFDAVSRQDRDDAVAAAKQALADVAAAKAARDSARINLDRTEIEAPIEGRIGRTLVTDGALVAAGQAQALAVIHTLDPIYVDVSQSSAEILRWKRKLAGGELETVGEDKLGVSLRLEDGSVYQHKGNLELREVAVDPSTGAVTLRAVFPNPDGLLLPGMFVRAQIMEGVRENAVLAPQKAIARNPEGEGVAYVVGAEGKAQERIVTTERAVGDQWIVTAGLKPGERLVVEGFQRFQPGDAVTPVELSRVVDASRNEPGATGAGVR